MDWILKLFFKKKIERLESDIKTVKTDLNNVKSMNERLMGYFPMIDKILSCQGQKELQKVRREYSRIINQYYQERMAHEAYKNEGEITKNINDAQSKMDSIKIKDS